MPQNSIKKSQYLLVLMAVCFCIMPWIIKNPFVIHLLIVAFWYGYMAMVWSIVGGIAEQLSLGHAAFVGVGAYTSTLLFTHFSISPWIGMLIGGVIASLLAVCIGWPCFRLRGAFFALGSLAFGAIIQMITLNTPQIYGLKINGAKGILLPLLGNAPLQFQFDHKLPYYYIILGLVGCVALVWYKIMNSKLGFYLRAIGENQEGAESLGVNSRVYKITALCISAFLAAIGGTFYSQLYLHIDPRGILTPELSVEFVLIALIGGKKSLFGPLLGAFLIIPLGEVLRTLLSSSFQGLHLLVYGIILILVILFTPEGIVGLMKRDLKTT